MEPVSTLLLVASFLAAPSMTSRPRWDARLDEPTPFVSTTSTLVYSNAEALVASTQTLVAPPIKSSKSFSSSTFSGNVKNGLYNELSTYRPSSQNDDLDRISTEEDVDLVVKFIDILPDGISLPKLMRSDDGEIGLYWDNNEAYVDINFDSNGTISLYSRHRATDFEIFIENVEIETVDATWAYTNLALTSTNNSHALAA